jgi:hypothetical protein
MRKTFAVRVGNNWVSKPTRFSPEAMHTVTERGAINTEKKVADLQKMEQSLPEDEREKRKERRDRYKPPEQPS